MASTDTKASNVGKPLGSLGESQQTAAPSKSSPSSLVSSGVRAENATPPAPHLRSEPKEVRHEKEVRMADGANWPVAGWLVFLHVGALAAPFFFSWQGLVLVFVLHWLSGGIGVCLGFHRLLTHSGFDTYKPVRYLLTLFGQMAGEGTAIDWVANHRKHHAHSDQEGDPHSPRDGSWWSHMFWLAYMTHGRDYKAHIDRWAPDLAKDPVIRWIGASFLPMQFLLGGLLAAAGYWVGGWYMATSFVVWGLFLRLVLVMHSTWFVNSASHMFGYRNYETTDDSRNCWWVAVITYGEGWHNNHHAYPRMAKHGHRWWEIDVTFMTIRLMRAVGLAWNVVDYKRRGE